MENVTEAKNSLIEILDKNSLTFVVERINQQTITLNPRIQGVGKQKREKFKQVSRVCEIAVLSEDKITRFESIVVTYPESNANTFASFFDKIITIANKRYKKLPR